MSKNDRKSIQTKTTVEDMRELAAELGVKIEVVFTPGNMYRVKVDGVDMYGEEDAMYSYDSPFPIKTPVENIMEELELVQERFSATCSKRMIQALESLNPKQLLNLQQLIKESGENK